MLSRRQFEEKFYWIWRKGEKCNEIAHLRFRFACHTGNMAKRTSPQSTSSIQPFTVERTSTSWNHWWHTCISCCSRRRLKLKRLFACCKVCALNQFCSKLFSPELNLQKSVQEETKCPFTYQFVMVHEPELEFNWLTSLTFDVSPFSLFINLLRDGLGQRPRVILIWLSLRSDFEAAFSQPIIL